METAATNSPVRLRVFLYFMGITQLVPLVASWEGREFLLLHLIFWLPAITVLLFRSGNLSVPKLFFSDRLSRLIGIWFSWGILSGSVALFYSLFSADGFATIRLMSIGALVVYGVFPLIGGWVIGQTELKRYMQGATIGLLGTCVALFLIYLYALRTDPEYIRLAVGQRVPAVLIFAIPCLVILPLRTFKFRLILIFFLTLVIWLSMARAAIIGWAVAIVIAVGFLAINNWRRASMVAVVALMAASCSLPMTFIGSRFEGVVVVNHVDSKIEVIEDSAATRLLIWREAIKSATTSPVALIFGRGQLGASHLLPTISAANGSTISGYSAHSEYLDQLLRGGVVGLLLLLAINFGLIHRGWKARDRKDNFDSLQLALGISTLAVGAYGVFHETTRYPWLGVVFWTTVGICLGRQVLRYGRSQVPENS